MRFILLHMCRFKIDLHSCRFIVNAYMPVTCSYVLYINTCILYVRTLRTIRRTYPCVYMYLCIVRVIYDRHESRITLNIRTRALVVLLLL